MCSHNLLFDYCDATSLYYNYKNVIGRLRNPCDTYPCLEMTIAEVVELLTQSDIQYDCLFYYNTGTQLLTEAHVCTCLSEIVEVGTQNNIIYIIRSESVH